MNEWERVGSYVEMGALPEDALMTAYCGIFQRAWSLTAPAIALIRMGWGPRAYELFEKLNDRAQKWGATDDLVTATRLVPTIKGGDLADRRDPAVPDRRIRN